MEANNEKDLFVRLGDAINIFGNKMASVNRENENSVARYFQNFERGLHVLIDRLREAEEELKRAEAALRRRRSERVWVEDDNGGGHYEDADCSAEEARVARCQSKCFQCQKNVNTCEHIISEARSKADAHQSIYKRLQLNVGTARAKFDMIKQQMDVYLNIDVPSTSMPSHAAVPHAASPSNLSQSSSSPTTHSATGDNGSSSSSKHWTRNYADLARPRAPRVDNPQPVNKTTYTEKDRPMSPFGPNGRVQRSNVPSCAAGLDEILRKYKKNTDQ